jgi:hypothetical protein
MTNSTPTQDPNAKPITPQEKLPSPLRCLSGALISGGFAIALYFVSSSIAHSFGSKPIASTNPTAINIAIAVRTLVVGISMLATFVFGLVAVGLIAITIQSSIQYLKNRNASQSDAQ